MVFNELKNRGMRDCFVACVDGLKGLPEAIESVFPHTQVQICIIHKVRNSLKYVSYKDRRAVAPVCQPGRKDLRAIYGAGTIEETEMALDEFSRHWDERYPAISPSWRVD